MMRHFTLAILFSSLLACSGSNSGSLGASSSGGTTDGGPSSSSEASTSTSEGSSNGGSSHTSTSDAGKDTSSSGPVVIKNFSAAPLDNGQSLTFALSNSSSEAIDRLQEITVNFGTGAGATFPITCQDFNWKVGPGETSPVIELKLTDSGGSAQLVYSPGCSSVYEGLSAAAGKQVTLDLKGLLEDATPWKAHAAAQ